MSGKYLTSTSSPLPIKTIWNTATGEQVPPLEFNTQITQLIGWVTTQTRSLYKTHSNQLHSQLNNVKTGSANSWGRQNGYTSEYKNLPTPVKAKSRINELVLHNLVTETKSYVNNPNPKKQPPSFSPKINLGAVDSQMASLSIEENNLTLSWKCWEKEYLVEFILPTYLVERRNIIKWCLPTVQLEHGNPVFRFPYQEPIIFNPETTHVAGVDLGRAEPYTIAIVNPTGSRVAHYTTSGRLKQLNQQRENILVHKKHVTSKLEQYQKLGINNVKKVRLEQEKKRLAGKAKILGEVLAQQLASEMTRKLAKHQLNLVKIENLSWVTGSKYGGRWNHSRQQHHITHSLARTGIKTKIVNPKNTSQSCHNCGDPITHNTNTRTVWCTQCKTRLDRDFNAAMNIAKIPYPNKNSMLGDKKQGFIPQLVNQPGFKSVPGTKTLTSFTT